MRIPLRRNVEGDADINLGDRIESYGLPFDMRTSSGTVATNISYAAAITLRDELTRLINSSPLNPKSFDDLIDEADEGSVEMEAVSQVVTVEEDNEGFTKTTTVTHYERA